MRWSRIGRIPRRGMTTRMLRPAEDSARPSVRPQGRVISGRSRACRSRVAVNGRPWACESCRHKSSMVFENPSMIFKNPSMVLLMYLIKSDQSNSELGNSKRHQWCRLSTRSPLHRRGARVHVARVCHGTGVGPGQRRGRHALTQRACGVTACAACHNSRPL